jgi:subtilisin family serine protease
MPVMSRPAARRWFVAGLAAVAAVTAIPVTAHAKPAGEELAPLVGSAGEVLRDQYIVVYRKGVTASVGRPVEQAATAGGGTVRLRFSRALQGFSATLPAAALAAVRRDPNVEFVQVNAKFKAVMDVGSWGLDRVNQRSLPLDSSYTAFGTGQGVHAYIIDTGVRMTHNEFTGRVGNGYDFIDYDTDASDCYGHGTHVASTVGGTTYGVAKQVTIHSIRVVDCGGFGTPETFAAGVEWMLTNLQRPAVANASLGWYDTYPNAQAIDLAVNNAVSAGVTFVVAAGNSWGNACYITPARVPDAITVGATDSTDRRANFSSHGSCLDLFAPGVGITAAWWGNDTGTFANTGTSMAAPHVAGVAALYLQRHPKATAQQVRHALVADSTKDIVTDPQPNSPNRLLHSLLPVRTPMEHDYTGDGVADLAVFRPSNGTWYVNGLSPAQWGQAGDIPVPGDYDGNGITDRAVFRNGSWYIFGQPTVIWGQPGDIPVPGDYTGDGKTDPAFFRPSTGWWYVYFGPWAQYGQSGDIPVPADYNGDGVDEIAVFRPSNGTWYIYGQSPIWWGQSGDIPVPADYDGDGRADATVYRPAEGLWYAWGLWWSYWGTNGDVPTSGDFDGDGIVDITVWRPSTGAWYVWAVIWEAIHGQYGDIPV